MHAELYNLNLKQTNIVHLGFAIYEFSVSWVCYFPIFLEDGRDGLPIGLRELPFVFCGFATQSISLTMPRKKYYPFVKLPTFLCFVTKFFEAISWLRGSFYLLCFVSLFLQCPWRPLGRRESSARPRISSEWKV